jgi:hypothetical protein
MSREKPKELKASGIHFGKYKAELSSLPAQTKLMPLRYKIQESPKLNNQNQSKISLNTAMAITLF